MVPCPRDAVRVRRDRVRVAWTGGTEFTTSLWRRDGTYVPPLKDAVRRSERIEIGDAIAVAMELRID